MNVACTACPAKYAVPDEKVRGRKVKITCKHCGTAIVVDGTKMDASGGASVAPAGASVVPAKATVVPLTSVAPDAKPAQAEAPAAKAAAAPAPKPEPERAAQRAEPAPKPAPEPAAAAPEPPPEIEWIVAFTDDRQDPATTAQVVEYYRAGHIDEGTYVWREGMDDWSAPFDIPELREALTAAGVARKSPPPPPFVGDEDEATRVASSPISADALNSSSGVWREPGKPAGPAKLPFEEPIPLKRQSSPPPAESPRAPAVAATAKKSDRPQAAAKAEPAKAQTAARAAKAEPAQRTAAARRRAERSASDDLFGSVAQAGSEQDASLHGNSAAQGESAAHGESAADGPRMTGQRNESSVLFSLDALIKTEKAATPTAAKAPAKKKDEEAAILFGDAPNSIANVGTGGMGIALAAPDFTAPVAAPPPSAPRASSPIEVSAPIPQKKKSSVGLILALLVLGGGTAAAVAMGIPQKLMGGAAPATTATAEQPKAATTTEPTAAPTPEPAATPTTSEAPATSATATPPATGTAPAAAPPKPGEAVAAKPGEARPADKAAPKDQPAPSGDLPPFDKAAAAAALGAAASNASSCRQPGGAMGAGRVTVTFAPSGRATSTNVSGEVAGTTVGGCVARLFKAVKVPAFSGDPVTVGKSFSIE